MRKTILLFALLVCVNLFAQQNNFNSTNSFNQIASLNDQETNLDKLNTEDVSSLLGAAGQGDMDKLVIQGGVALKGEVQISGAKNAALPVLMGDSVGGLAGEGWACWRQRGGTAEAKENTVLLAAAAGEPTFAAAPAHASTFVSCGRSGRGVGWGGAAHEGELRDEGDRAVHHNQSPLGCGERLRPRSRRGSAHRRG